MERVVYMRPRDFTQLRAVFRRQRGRLRNITFAPVVFEEFRLYRINAEEKDFLLNSSRTPVSTPHRDNLGQVIPKWMVVMSDPQKELIAQLKTFGEEYTENVLGLKNSSELLFHSQRKIKSLYEHSLSTEKTHWSVSTYEILEEWTVSYWKALMEKVKSLVGKQAVDRMLAGDSDIFDPGQVMTIEKEFFHLVTRVCGNMSLTRHKKVTSELYRTMRDYRSFGMHLINTLNSFSEVFMDHVLSKHIKETKRSEEIVNPYAKNIVAAFDDAEQCMDENAVLLLRKWCTRTWKATCERFKFMIVKQVVVVEKNVEAFDPTPVKSAEKLLIAVVKYIDSDYPIEQVHEITKSITGDEFKRSLQEQIVRREINGKLGT